MLDLLQQFVWACELGSVTAAARRAHLTQPALTAAMRRLESQMGARLLHRLPRGVKPTAAGDALLPRAYAALAAAEEGRRAVAEVAGLQAGEVRVGGGATACTHLLPPVLAAFAAQYPGVRIRLRETFTPSVRGQVDNGTLDIGVGLGGDGPHDPWVSIPAVLVASPALAARLPTQDPTRHAPFVGFVHGSALRALLDAHFPEAEVGMELASIAAVLGHTRAGLGLALLSRTAIADDLALGRLVELPDPRTPLLRQLAILHRGVHRLPPAAARLRQMLLESAGDPTG